PQSDLAPAARWGGLLRAPVALQQRLAAPDLAPLSDWAAVQRGYTTGANDFFYLDAAAVARWGIEPAFRRPLLKSLRNLDRLQLTPADCRHELLLIPPQADLHETAVAAYVAWGEAHGFHRRRSLADRGGPWYSLPPQAAAPPDGALLLPKGIWRRHMAPLLAAGVSVDQQLYQVTPAPGVDPRVAAALLNSAWAIWQLELHGRVNFGAGLLWLAAYEVAALRLPDPRRLPEAAAARLRACFAPLAVRPCQDVETELAQPDRQALDTAVFDLLALDAAQRTAVYQALRDRVQARRRRAASV
ncbi:MAG: hypothetical protein KC425_09215, partial [Anaerolineales bacterium]|nr:hypothetical protein [Anaerolineales bacterium]